MTDNEYNGHSILEVDLIDDPKDDGQTRIPLSESRFGNKVSGFSVKVRELYAVHGTGIWGSETPQFASLLIYRIKAVDYEPSRGRRLKNITVRLRFKSDKANSLPEDDPYITCFAPAQDHKIGILPTSVLREKHHNKKISLNVDTNPIHIALAPELANENSWQWKKDVWATIAGEAHQSPYGRGRRGDNVVHWAISENDKAHQIMDTVDIGILIRRPNDQSFTVDFSGVDATIDWQYAVYKKTQNTINAIRHLVGDESVTNKKHLYDPAKQGSWPKGITGKDLHVLEEGMNLDKFTFMHILHRIRGIKYDESDDQTSED